MHSRAIKKLVLNPKAFQKSAAIHRVKASTEDGKVAKQSDDYAEFDQSLQELPEFASAQKQDEPSTLVQDPTEDVNIGSEGQSQDSQDRYQSKSWKKRKGSLIFSSNMKKCSHGHMKICRA